MILQQKYSRPDFLEFQKQFLPDFTKDIRSVDRRGLQVTKDVVQLGYSDQLDLKIFEFTHTSSSDPRVSLTRDGFRVMKDSATYLALVAYHSEISDDWRLSLMMANLEINEKGRVKQSFSDPRRYSFFLGPDARMHTPQDFLIKKGQAKDTADLLSRFDVEIVTKEFFTKYKGLFEDISDYLEKDHDFKIFAGKNNIDIDNFAKKLLGQIVFCYFLQRKGWLGAKKGELVNKGDKYFMRSLFNRRAEGKNFYNDYLEYLFYGSFNSKTEGSGDFYRKHFDCQIPFLNGGLFEPPEGYDWEKSFVHISDKLFSNKENTGILDVFDLYNFTVYEDDPIDREVSVDPEMLGKVFENLLSENLRKGQGAYYTPREIVHYMCQESLINYLATEIKVDIAKIRDLVVNKHFEGEGSKELIDKALQAIRVCDPACGSGAFLVGMLHEIVNARYILNPHQDGYQLRKETIQNCIYGVDIDPGAVEISKLRLWLSLVVDCESKEIEPLPNLDYKIMQGNSLLEEFEGIKLFDEKLLHVSTKFNKHRLEQLESKEKDLNGKLMEYYQKNPLWMRNKKLHRPLELLQLESDIKQVQQGIKYEKKLEFGDSLTAKQREINFGREVTSEEIWQELEQLHKGVFKASQKFQKDNIKQEISNLELRLIEITLKEQNKISTLQNIDKLRKSSARPFFLWKLHFAEVFQENGGFDVMIANPPYIDYRKIDYQTKNGLFNFFSYCRSKTASIYVYFIELGCNLLKKRGVCCYINPYQYLIADSGIGIREFLINNTSISKIIDVSNIKVFQSAATYTCINIFKKEIEDHNKIEIVRCKTLGDINKVGFSISQNTIKKDSYLISINPLNNIILKIEKDSSYLKDFCNIFCGTSMAGFGREIINSEQYNNLAESKKGNFLVVKQSSDIKRYYFDKSLSFINKKVYSDNVISKFKKKNIFFARMTKDIRCMYSENEYAGGKVNILIDFSVSPKLLLSLLNSKLINFWYRIKFESKHLSGGYLGFDIPSVEIIPIKIATFVIEKSLIEKVENILKITQHVDYQDDSNRQSEVKEYERQIDQMVYELYGLTKDEIEIVEGDHNR